MKKILILLVIAILAVSCGRQGMNNWQRVDLPEGYGDSHILSIDVKGSGILLGTYGRGRFSPKMEAPNGLFTIQPAASPGISYWAATGMRTTWCSPLSETV